MIEKYGVDSSELEDTFDIELDENEVTKITTLEEALKLLEELQ